MEMLKRFLLEEKGQDVLEWGMLAAFLSTLLIATVVAIDDVILAWYTDVQEDIVGP
jgi:Flp pilus assembly pilin Flp